MSDDGQPLDARDGIYVELDKPGSGQLRRHGVAELAARFAALTDTDTGGGGGGGWIYGDGSDGDLVLHDGDLWVPGFYHDVTIEAGATVRVDPTTAGAWPVFRGTGRFTILSTLDLSGVDATDLNGVQPHVGPPYTALGVGQSGQQGDGAGQTLSGATADSPFGGAGGDGSAGTGGPIGSPTYRKQLGLRTAGGLIGTPFNAVPGGGASGAGDGTNYGGGGGSGGDWAIICFRHIVHGADNLYNLQGGAGAPGGDDGTGTTGNGDCGGGGGGGAGYWVTISDDLAGPDANIIGTGGAGGAGCGTGTDGQPGDDGFVIHLLNT